MTLRNRLMFMLLLALVVGFLVLSLKTVPAQAWSSNCKHPGSARLALLPREYPHFTRALKKYFRHEWRRAAITAWAEGHWNAYAKNGQYLGTFQMGSWARSNYGHSYNLVGQVRHAAANYRQNGWSQWECAWYGAY
jgi:hypothetical protein